ncbi:MAG: hypothetical protein GX029_13760 [Pseudomonadaceae bacterium]|nr:hypothetical protein [Pseudomonadaceae bacterium]
MIAKVVMDYILLKRQRDATNWDVNMFNKTSLITLEEFSANVALTHKTIMPKVGLKVIDSQAVADYKEHFTRFDEMLQFIVAARFAKDRKQAYVWLHATSDWGKSFFKSLFDKMGLVVEMSVKEIEAAFESKPFAKSPRDFLNAFILVVEEFKSVKSEIKQLEREIRISPKNQPEATVPIYAKMFLSANTVGGLVGESGVEEQFANRFSYIKESGNLSERAMFKSIGKTDYHDSVTLYAAQEINKMVLSMVAMGEREATKFAENWISEFIGRYGIGKTFGRFENTLPELAADINHWLINTSNQSASANYNPSQSFNNFVLYSNGQAFLLRGTKAVNEYIKLNYTPAEAGSLYPVIPELLLLLSSDGKGIIPRKINGKSEKAVSLKVSDISLIPR